MPVARQQDAIKAEVAALKGHLSLAEPPARRQEALRSLQRLLDVSDITNGRIVGWIANSTRRLLPDVLAMLKDGKRDVTAEVFATLSIMAKGCGECLQGYESDVAAVFAELLHHPTRAGGGGDDQPAIQCLKTWIRHVHAAAMLPVAFSAFADQHNRQLRARAMECIVFFLEEWPASQMSRHGEALERILQEGLGDARLGKLARRGAELFAERHATGQGQRGAALQRQGLDRTVEGDGTVADQADVEEDDSRDEWSPGGVQMTVNIVEERPRRGVPRHGRRAATTAERSDATPSSPQDGAPTMMRRDAEAPAPAPRVDPTRYASLCEARAREARTRNPKLLGPPPTSSESKQRPSSVRQPKEKVKTKPALPRQARGKIMGPTLLGIGYTGSEWRSVDEDKAARVGAHQVAAERLRRVSAPADLLTGPVPREGEKYLEGVVAGAGGGAVASVGSKPKGRRRRPGPGVVGYKASGPALPESHPLYRGGLDTGTSSKSHGGGAGQQRLAEICAEEAEAQASLASLNAALGTKRGYVSNNLGWQHPQQQVQQVQHPQQQQQYPQTWALQQCSQPPLQNQHPVPAPNWTHATHMHHFNPIQNQQWQEQQRDEQAWILQRQQQLQQQAQAQLGSSVSAPPVVGPRGVYLL